MANVWEDATLPCMAWHAENGDRYFKNYLFYETRLVPYTGTTMKHF
jgi:hypothetical protein